MRDGGRSTVPLPGVPSETGPLREEARARPGMCSSAGLRRHAVTTKPYPLSRGDPPARRRGDRLAGRSAAYAEGPFGRFRSALGRRLFLRGMGVRFKKSPVGFPHRAVACPQAIYPAVSWEILFRHAHSTAALAWAFHSHHGLVHMAFHRSGPVTCCSRFMRAGRQIVSGEFG